MFTVYGPGITNPVPLEKLFVQPAVKKAVPVAPKQAIEEEGSVGSSQYPAFRSAMAKQQYQAANSVSSRSPALKASQIMTEPVVSLHIFLFCLRTTGLSAFQLPSASLALKINNIF